MQQSSSGMVAKCIIWAVASIMAVPTKPVGFVISTSLHSPWVTFLKNGTQRIFYIDLDAHHGDGVQDAFHDDDRVFTLSIHEGGRWPMDRRSTNPDTQPGGIMDRAGGAARNLPVPPGLNDDELEALIEGVALPLITSFEPEALFIQCGVDALSDDPQSRIELSNTALWRAVRTLKDLAPPPDRFWWRWIQPLQRGAWLGRYLGRARWVRCA